jgi:hypothetical protein
MVDRVAFLFQHILAVNGGPREPKIATDRVDAITREEARMPHPYLAPRPHRQCAIMHFWLFYAWYESRVV